MTVPRYFFTNSGYFCTASDIEQNIIPFSVSVSLNVVATETESNTASTAIPFNLCCSCNGIPSFL